MSTRSIITFKDSDYMVQAYKHWDGYPETTVTELQEFLKWNGFRNDDLSYTMANFVYWYKNRYSEFDKEPSLNDHAHTGIGILPRQSVNAKEAYDEYSAEFFYIVDLTEMRIYEENTGLFWELGEIPESDEKLNGHRYMGYKVEEMIAQ